MQKQPSSADSAPLGFEERKWGERPAGGRVYLRVRPINRVVGSSGGSSRVSVGWSMSQVSVFTSNAELLFGRIESAPFIQCTGRALVLQEQDEAPRPGQLGRLGPGRVPPGV